MITLTFVVLRFFWQDQRCARGASSSGDEEFRRQACCSPCVEYGSERQLASHEVRPLYADKLGSLDDAPVSR